MTSELRNVDKFFGDLKKYNLTNFRTLECADLSESSFVICKAFSSVVTRYFIFCEMHPELTVTEKRLLYFGLKIDMIAKYFSEYPDSDIEFLKEFQQELREFVQRRKDLR